MCDASYLCQTERLEREVLTLITLIPHMDEKARKQVPTSVDQVRAEFDEWLYEPPPEATMTAEESESVVLNRLLGVSKGR